MQFGGNFVKINFSQHNFHPYSDGLSLYSSGSHAHTQIDNKIS